MSHLGAVGNKEHLWVLHVLQVLVTPHLSCPILQSPRLSNCSLCRSNSWPLNFSHHSLVFQFNNVLMGSGDQGKAPYTKAKQEPSESYFSLCPNNFFFFPFHFPLLFTYCVKATDSKCRIAVLGHGYTGSGTRGLKVDLGLNVSQRGMSEFFLLSEMAVALWLQQFVLRYFSIPSCSLISLLLLITHTHVFVFQQSCL